ncbi:hypothetical protein O181_120036 [Austropuccinia psidii MF-1]|uniref:Uncharacterized protein n=1 Tax=Austropuccinia psidii MF-1 TaxID=1389203 RepID=A0A9Q3KGX0_9BASI|nr:hypothetical protein [Austropuccinia psidii MF-1]
MEATIWCNQMDVDKEEARPNPEVPGLPQERHIWRMPELPPIPQGLSVPTDFEMNSEPELIHDNISRAEPFSGASNRSISMPVQKLVQKRQRRGVGNMPKPLEGGHELLLTHQELSKSEEYYRALRRLEPIVLQRQGQKGKELVEEPKSLIHRLEERVGNDSSFGDRGPSGVYRLQKCPRTSPKDLRRSREVPRAIKEKAKAKPIGTDLTHKGTGSPNWSLQPWTVYSTWPGL